MCSGGNWRRVLTRINWAGRRLGKLVVTGEDIFRPKFGSGIRQKWVAVCDCGAVATDLIDSLKRRKHCGNCAELRPPHPHKKPTPVGQKFAMLECIGVGDMVRTKAGQSYRAYIYRCDCGNVIHKNRWDIERNGQRSCGCLGRDRVGRVNNARKNGVPPTPVPLPPEVTEIIIKYLRYTTHAKWFDGAINHEEEDALMEVLTRVAWTITYRKSQGIEFTEYHEKKLILKHFYFTKLQIKQGDKRYARCPSLQYYRKDKMEKIGSQVTNKTFDIEPVIETLADTFYGKRPKKFKRC